MGHIQTTGCHFSLCAASSQSQSRPVKTGPHLVNTNNETGPAWSKHDFLIGKRFENWVWKAQESSLVVYKTSSGKTLRTTMPGLIWILELDQIPNQLRLVPNQLRPVQTGSDSSKPDQTRPNRIRFIRTSSDSFQTSSDPSKPAQIRPNRITRPNRIRLFPNRIRLIQNQPRLIQNQLRFIQNQPRLIQACSD